MAVLITRTTPKLFFQFLDAVSSVQPATIYQIRACLKAPNLGSVHAARAFSQHYGFIESDNKKFKLTNLGERLLSYTDNARFDFLISFVKIQEKEPFLFLKRELQKNKILKLTRIAELLQIKFQLKEKWLAEDQMRIGKVYGQWLIQLRQAKLDGDSIEYMGGKVKTFEILVIPEMKELLDRCLYDYLVENFHTPHNILREPYELLEKTKESQDANKKGEAFEEFVGSCFRVIGFTPRSRDGIREKSRNLTYQRKGGGDVGLFCHFPTPTPTKTHQGYAIACEAKAGSYPIGSKAVGQVRNLSQKIMEVFTDYLVHAIVISRSRFGYDSSGKEQAPPEVVHIQDKVLLDILQEQKNRLSKGLSLITPIHFMVVLKEFIKEQKLEPTPTEFMKKLSIV